MPALGAQDDLPLAFDIPGWRQAQPPYMNQRSATPFETKPS